jgi:hypothetical protein
VSSVETHDDAPAPMPTTLVALAVAAMGVGFAALIFVPAGRLDWTLGWAYVGILLVNVAINWACLRRWNPELIERRMRFGKGTKTWDKVWAVLYAPIAYAVYVVAGLEARDGVSSLPGLTWLLGAVIFVPGSAMLTWSMVVNPFFEKTVRIQTDRGHRVIDTGPYAYVRARVGLGLRAGRARGGGDRDPHGARGSYAPCGAPRLPGVRGAGALPADPPRLVAVIGSSVLGSARGRPRPRSLSRLTRSGAPEARMRWFAWGSRSY